MSTSPSSFLFGRGADKVYFALSLTCLIYILCISDPFPILYRDSADWLADARDASVDKNFEVRPLDLKEVFKKEQTAKDANNYFPENTWFPPKVTGLNEERMEEAVPYIKAIMDPTDKHFERVQCPRPFKSRYKGLRRRRNLASRLQEVPKQYFFALNLFECAHVLPRLLSSVVETIRYLRPEDCVLSIVGGRSGDGTTEILTRLRHEMKDLNVTYYFSTSDIDPLKDGNDRITELAKLRNLVLDPLIRQPDKFSPDTSVVFLNDVAVCTDDILELIYQKTFQKADMVCSMDWVDHGDTFYDSWISRGMTGDMFIEIPQSGSFEFKQNLFWNDPATKKRFEAGLPFQVYACWNGGAVFTARPLLRHNVTFRASYKDECYMGEPTLFCKDFWAQGFGKIAVIPSVNVGYNNDESRGAKEKFGFASDMIWRAERVEHRNTRIRWKHSPPQLVKCEPDWRHPSWVRWDQVQDRQVPFDWTHSGYFNAHSNNEEERKDAELEREGADEKHGGGDEGRQKDPDVEEDGDEDGEDGDEDEDEEGEEGDEEDGDGDGDVVVDEEDAEEDADADADDEKNGKHRKPKGKEEIDDKHAKPKDKDEDEDKHPEAKGNDENNDEHRKPKAKGKDEIDDKHRKPKAKAKDEAEGVEDDAGKGPDNHGGHQDHDIEEPEEEIEEIAEEGPELENDGEDVEQKQI